MFERLTEQAREAMVLGQEESRALNHNYVGTEHILLGLLRVENGLATGVLPRLGVTAEAVREQIVQIVGQGEAPEPGQIPFTIKAKRVIEHALKESLKLRNNYVGDQHLLLGILRERDGVAMQVLGNVGVDADEVRDAVLRVPVPQQIRVESASPAGPDDGRLLLHLVQADGRIAEFLRERGITEEAVRERFGIDA